MKNLPGTLAGEDIEALHDMRVASRRCRAALRIFRGCLPKRGLDIVEPSLGAVTRALGGVRDQDVFLEFLRCGNGRTPRSKPTWIIERESLIREQARVRMIERLEELAREDLPASVAGMLARVSMTKPVSGKRRSQAFALQALPIVKTRLRKLRGLARSLKDAEKTTDHHLMRIAAKRLRYTLEAFAPCFGVPMAEAISAVKLLQEQLGQIHDCDVWCDKLARYRDEPGLSPARLRVVSGLIEHLQARREQVFAEAGHYWGILEQHKLAAGLKKLVGPSSARTLIRKGATKSKPSKPRPRSR